MDDLEKAIREVCSRIKNFDGRPGRINEADTIRVLITPMIEALGWNTLDLDEVQSEYRHKAGDNPVDYALFVDGSPALFVEAKALDENLNDRRWIVQTLNYANACNVPWTVLTNGQEWRVYKVHVQREAEEKLFYSAKLTFQSPAEVAKRLIMLARVSMAPKPALDKLWREAEVDMKMRKVIEGLADNKSAVRAMAKASNGLMEKDVKEALRRIKLRADWRDDEDLFPISDMDNSQFVENQDGSLPDLETVPESLVLVDETDSLLNKRVRKASEKYIGEWPEEATHIMYGSGYCAFGHFDVETQAIKILKGSIIVKDHKDDKYLTSQAKEWKHDNIKAKALIDEGVNKLKLIVDSGYYRPSTAASLVACSSRDGWTYWRDRKENTLHGLRA